MVYFLPKKVVEVMPPAINSAGKGIKLEIKISEITL